MALSLSRDLVVVDEGLAASAARSNFAVGADHIAAERLQRRQRGPECRRSPRVADLSAPTGYALA